MRYAFLRGLAALTAVCAALLAVPAPTPAQGAGGETKPENLAENFSENFSMWPLLTPTFPSRGGGGIIIKGYDPVVTGGKCVTTFMAVEPGDKPNVYLNVVEFDAVAVAGGTLCRDGKWRAIDGSATGTTPLRVFFKDGTARRSP